MLTKENKRNQELLEGVPQAMPSVGGESLFLAFQFVSSTRHGRGAGGGGG